MIIQIKNYQLKFLFDPRIERKIRVVSLSNDSGDLYAQYELQGLV